MTTSKALSPVKARLPRGLADRGAADLAATAQMLEVIRRTYELYGFEAVETPFIEYTEALGKFLPDLDRPNEGVFSFQDDDEQWLSLRYDLTAPLARYVAEHFDALPKPYRSYRAGYVFRNEKPGPGRFRQFMQFDADIVGASSVAADAEICMMAADTLEELGIQRGDYVIKVNHRKVLDGVLEAIGLVGDENAGRRLTVLRAIDKADKFPWPEIEKLLGAGRKDESGDFTKGAGLNEKQIARIEKLFGSVTSNEFEFMNLGSDCFALAGDNDTARPEDMYEAGTSKHISNLKTLEAWKSFFSDCPLSLEGIQELQEIIALCEAAGFGSKRIRVSTSVIRGLEYYTGPVFEAELTFEVRDEDGRPVRFGSVGGGGRYDGLIGRFRAEPVPATGFSIGVSRLYAALKAIKSPLLASTHKHGPVVVLVMDKDQTQLYQKLVMSLRQNGINADMYLGAAGMNAQLKYADKRNSPIAIIQGSNEREAGTIIIKDLIAGAELAASAKTLEREAYLALKEKAQLTVPENELIAAVKQVLARYSKLVKAFGENRLLIHPKL